MLQLESKPGILLSNGDLTTVLSAFGLSFCEINERYDTSHGPQDLRYNFILDRKHVLKINSQRSIWEARLQAISRLIDRYRFIGIYAPQLLHTIDGSLSHPIMLDGTLCTCFAEEYAIYPTYAWDAEHDRGEVVEHLGLLAAKYTNCDLSEIRSMRTIIDTAPLDKPGIDEKQENAGTLIAALRAHGEQALADGLEALNHSLCERITEDFAALPRCVYQGDLNNSNELQNDGHFVGLIDFNNSGTDVNINVFLNETNYFPGPEDFDNLSVPEILERIDTEQEALLRVIWKHYKLNEPERRLLPYFKRIVDLFQYPNVCEMVKWLNDEARRDKCLSLLHGLLDKPL